MEEQLTDLLRHRIIQEEYRSSEAITDHFDNVTSKQKLELTHNAEIIGDDLYSEANDVPKRRNTLLHDTTERLQIQDRRIQLNVIKECVSAPEMLAEELNE